jgi:hypothetical protein
VNTHGDGSKALNLSLPKELIKLMKIHCIESETDVSTLTESLYIEFLEKRGIKISTLKKKLPKEKDETGKSAKRFIHNSAPK